MPEDDRLAEGPPPPPPPMPDIMLDDSHYRAAFAWIDVMLVIVLALAVFAYVLF